MSSSPAKPRLFYVEYKSAVNGRIGRAFIKVPYEGWRDSLAALNKEMARKQLAGEITRFTIETARAGTVTEEVRASLARWRAALKTTTKHTKVEWT